MRAWLRREFGRAPAFHLSLLVALAAFAAYANSLRAGFHYDDAHHIVGNPYVRDLAYLPRHFGSAETFSALPGHNMYRPVVMTTLALNYHWGGYDPLPWRLTAIALHALAAVGVFLTVRTLSARLVSRPDPVADTRGGLVAAVCFAVHPVFTETVDYASARSSLLATALAVWAFLLHQRSESARRAPARLALHLGSLLLFAAALLSKETAIVYPALLLLGAMLQRRGFRAAIPAVAVAALYLVVRKIVLGNAVIDFQARAAAAAAADAGSGGARPVSHNLFTQARVLLSYLGLLVLPKDLCVDRYVRISRTPLEPGVVAGALAVLALLLLAWRWRGKRPLASFGILWFLLGLAPTSSIIPLNVVMGEHRLYFPGIGAALVLASFVRRARLFWIPVAGALLVLTLRRNLDWNDGARLWESAVRVSPRSSGAWNSLGLARDAAGDFEGATAAWRRALEIDPKSWNAAFNLGTSHLRRGRDRGDDALLAEGERWLGESLRIRPDATRSQWFLAEALWARGRPDKARAEFERLAGLSPQLFEMTRYPLAKLAIERGDRAEAEARYREALRDGADPVAPRLGLARLHADAGEVRRAREEAEAAAAARRHDPAPHLFLAKLEPGTARAASHLFEAERLGYRPSGEERLFVLSGRRPR